MAVSVSHAALAANFPDIWQVGQGPVGPTTRHPAWPGCRGAGLLIGLGGAEDQVGDGAGVGDHGGVG